MSEHLVARNGPFARCVEEYMRLLLSILVVVVYWATRFKQRVIDGQVEEGGRQSAHLPLLVESKPRKEQLGQVIENVKLQLGFPSGPRWAGVRICMCATTTGDYHYTTV